MLRMLQFTLFLTCVLAILYLSNLAVYKSALDAFALTTSTSHVLLGVSLGVLSGSFILASIIGSWFYNCFTRVYYTLAAVWMGVFTYLLLAALAYSLVVALFPMGGSIAPWLVGTALLVSAYGVLHAREIAVTRVTITLPQLPQTWRGRTAVWTSDIHLGQIYGYHFAEKITRITNGLNPDIIFIGGDLYDGTGAPDIPELTAPLEKLSAPLGVYFISGNHEEYGNRERFFTAVQSVGMKILKDEMVEIDGLQIVGVDYQNAAHADRFTSILSTLTLDPRKPSLLLKHEPKDLAIAEAAGITCQISGHTHNAQMWPLGYIAQLTYKGYAYGLKKYKSMQVYVSSGTGTWGPPMRVGTKSEIVHITFQ